MEPKTKILLRDLPNELAGERVVLRPRCPGDGAAIYEAVEESREQIGPWLPWVEKTRTPEESEATSRRAMARWLLREDLMVGIWERSTGRFLGGSGLHRIDWSIPAFEIGYWLRTSAWGQGYVSEAVQILCRFAFETLSANRVEVRCDSKNTRSRAVPMRLGFVQEATLRSDCRDAQGELRDTLVFAMTPEDYRRTRDGRLQAQIQQQIAYYRARAGEYDEWFLRLGRYDRGSELNSLWFDEVTQAQARLDAFQPGGRVLELACGTGLWTERLAPHAQSLTALDASPEVLAINSARVGDPKVRYEEADLLEWTPEGPYDVVFFGFWLSHVPPERFEEFWNMVARCLAPGGRVFFVDSRYEPTSAAADHTLAGDDALTTTRRLNDGREFQIVKVFYQPGELAARLARLGWAFRVHTTANYFLIGEGARAGN